MATYWSESPYSSRQFKKTGLAPWEFEFHFSGSLLPTFLVLEGAYIAEMPPTPLSSGLGTNKTVKSTNKTVEARFRSCREPCFRQKSLDLSIRPRTDVYSCAILLAEVPLPGEEQTPFKRVQYGTNETVKARFCP